VTPRHIAATTGMSVGLPTDGGQLTSWRLS
jgi:hypothetical protein